jgi:hypothetical protein
VQPHHEEGSAVRTPRTIYTLILLALFALPACARQDKPAAPSPAPDVLIFTNGDQLTGHLERFIAGSIVFKSDMAGEITISVDKIKELRSATKFAVLRKGPPSPNNLVGEGDVHIADNNLTVTSANQPPATIATKDLGFLVDTPTYDKQVNHRVKFTEGWAGAITGGATVVRSTDDNTSLTLGIALARVMPSVTYLPLRNRTTFNVVETYGKSTSPVIPQTAPPSPPQITKTSIFHSDAERDEYFNPRFFALADVAFDHNFSQGLNLQQLYGGGIGWTPIETSRQQLDLKADVHYERQNFQTGTNPDLIGTVFGELYHRNLAHKIVFTENGNFIPAWNHPSDYSAMVTGALVLPTYKKLSTSLSVTDNFLNDPSPGYNKNSFQFVAGVAYALP